MERPKPRVRSEDLAEGARRVALVLRARELRAQGAGWERIGFALGVPFPTVFKWCRKVQAIQNPTAEDLAPKRAPGAAPKVDWLPEEKRAVRSLNLLSNRTATAGSAEAAVRRALRDGAIRPELAAHLQAREAEGQPMLTDAMRQAVRVSPATVRSFRHPREAWLDYVQSPGQQMLTKDPVTGEERPWKPGEAWTIDDGTINFVCCVPTDDPQWRHGVMPGRFQFLLIVDQRTYFIPGFSYTARPRGSYRAEDLVATIGNAVEEHGAPRAMILEHGVSAADLVTRCLTGLGVEILRANSPHQKIVELVFNNLWTLLSFEPGQVGRSRGEEAEVTAILESCRRGAKDPRAFFPMLADVLRALREAIAQWNEHRVNGSRWGEWQPAEFWTRAAHETLRRIPEQDRWLFWPHVTDALKVQGLQIATSVLFAPGFSQVFTFADPSSQSWLIDYVGARVHLHFNPFAPEGTAVAVLAADFAGARAGTVLGELELIDRQARRTRRMWGYSLEEDDGGKVARINAHALYRSTQAIRPDGKPGVQTQEARNGLGAVQQVRSGALEQAPAPAPRRRGPVTAAPRLGPRCCPAAEDPELLEFVEGPF